jgi:hypothetical protein
MNFIEGTSNLSKMIFVSVFVLSIFASAINGFPQNTQNIVTTDIDNFREADDKITAAKDGNILKVQYKTDL